MFRGRVKGGPWIMGFPLQVNGEWYMSDSDGFRHKVDGDTVTQNTFRPCKDGTMMFEGDMIVAGTGPESSVVTIVWDEQKAGFDTEPRITYAEWGWSEAVIDKNHELRLIGDRWDGVTNPKLLWAMQLK